MECTLIWSLNLSPRPSALPNNPPADSKMALPSDDKVALPTDYEVNLLNNLSQVTERQALRAEFEQLTIIAV